MAGAVVGDLGGEPGGSRGTADMMEPGKRLSSGAVVMWV
jgi:hypothetical protein